jgi:hypothetical protein
LEVTDYFFSPIGFAISSPLLIYMIYSIRRDGLQLVLAALRCLKWITLTFFLAVFLNATIFVGEFAYAVRNSCDDMKASTAVANGRGDIAEGRAQICTLIGTVENDYVALQIHVDRRLRPAKTLIGYSPIDDHDPVLRWVDDDTLSVDLGKVSWVSPRLDKVGTIRILYSYVMVN